MMSFEGLTDYPGDEDRAVLDHLGEAVHQRWLDRALHEQSVDWHARAEIVLAADFLRKTSVVHLHVSAMINKACGADAGAARDVLQSLRSLSHSFGGVRKALIAELVRRSDMQRPIGDTGYAAGLVLTAVALGEEAVVAVGDLVDDVVERALTSPSPHRPGDWRAWSIAQKACSGRWGGEGVDYVQVVPGDVANAVTISAMMRIVQSGRVSKQSVVSYMPVEIRLPTSISVEGAGISVGNGLAEFDAGGRPGWNQHVERALREVPDLHTICVRNLEAHVLRAKCDLAHSMPKLQQSASAICLHELLIALHCDCEIASRTSVSVFCSFEKYVRDTVRGGRDVQLEVTLDKRGPARDQLDSDQKTNCISRLLSIGVKDLVVSVSGRRELDGLNTFISALLRSALHTVQRISITKRSLSDEHMSQKKLKFVLVRRDQQLMVKNIGERKYVAVQRFVKLGVHKVNIERLV